MYRYYKNHFIPRDGGKDQLYQKNIAKKGQVFNLSFKYNGLPIALGMSTIRS